MYLKENGKVRYMMKYIDKDYSLFKRNKISMESLVWSYLSKRVKEEYGEKVSWVGDQELWSLFVRIQRPKERFLDNVLSSFGGYSIMKGNDERINTGDYTSEINGEIR